MADNVIHLELCAPETAPQALEVTQLIVPGEGGVFTVLPNHTPVLTTLIPGVLLADTTDGEHLHYAISGGFAEVLHNRVTLLARTFEEHDAIDRQRAKEAQDRAEQRLAKKQEDLDIMRAELALARALARLQAHSRQGY